MTATPHRQVSRRAVLAVAGAGLVVATVGGSATTTASTAATARRGTGPVVHPDRRVTFTLTAPAATEVTVTGCWGRSFTDATAALTRDRDEWRVTVGPLAPSLYTYRFEVDGEERASATLLVPGPGAEFITRQDVPVGAVHTLTYPSAVTRSDRQATVWTPPGYTTTGVPYPTLYLLHGGRGSRLDWVQQGLAPVILANLLAAGKIVPMVVVLPDCNVGGLVAAPSADRMPVELVANLVPAVAGDYHVVRSGTGRALAGPSIGGLQTWNTMLSHPGEFAYIGDFSAGYFLRTMAALSTTDAHLLDAPAVNARTRLHRIYLGNADDVVVEQNRQTRALFDRHGIRYQFSQFRTAGHAWETWRHNLADFTPRLF